MSTEPETAYRRLGALYARAVDRNDPELLAGLFTADAVIAGPGFSMRGREEIKAIPGMLKRMYHLTLHLVLNQVLEVSGDTAQGETCCLANHLTVKGTAASNLVWAVRYQDSLRREHGQWRYASREVIVDWTETRPAELPDVSPG